MKLKIRYETKEKIYSGSGVYQHVIAYTELEPVRIMRYPCGTGAAANRYYYEAQFLAPDDAEFVDEGVIRAAINRKLNPFFNPKKLVFEKNVCAPNATVRRPPDDF